MTFKFVKNKATEKAIEDLPDKAVYETARQILDLTYPTIPMSKPSGMNFGVESGHTSGYLRRSTMNAGVKGSNRDYYIESTAEYTLDGRFVTKTIDSLGKVTTYDINTTNGLTNSITDANNITTYYTYNDKDQITKNIILPMIIS